MTLISAQITLQLNRLLLLSSLQDRAPKDPQGIIQNAKPVLPAPNQQIYTHEQYPCIYCQID